MSITDTTVAKKKRKSKQSLESEDIETECLHIQTSNLDGISVCDNCGFKVEELLTETDKYYGATDSKWSKDPSRFHIRRDLERSLYQDWKSEN